MSPRGILGVGIFPRQRTAEAVRGRLIELGKAIVGLYVNPVAVVAAGRSLTGRWVRSDRRSEEQGVEAGSPVTQLAVWAVRRASLRRPHPPSASGDQRPRPLLDRACGFVGGVVSHGLVDLVREPAFEAADGLAGGLALGAFALVVGPALGRGAGLVMAMM